MRVVRTGLPWLLVIEGTFWMAVRACRNTWNRRVRYREFPTAICEWCSSWDFEVGMRAIAERDGSEPLLCADCFHWHPTVERIRAQLDAWSRQRLASLIAIPAVDPVTWEFTAVLGAVVVVLFVAIWFVDRRAVMHESQTAFRRYADRAQKNSPRQDMPVPNAGAHPVQHGKDSAHRAVSQ